MSTALALDPAIARRHDIPTGAVPEYSEFLRRVWAWHDEYGNSCVGAPPWMYSIIIHEPVEVMFVSSLLGTIHMTSEFKDRFEIIVMEDGSEFSFADLAALHTFLRACATLGSTNETARRVCEYVMWTLGFRWV